MKKDKKKAKKKAEKLAGQAEKKHSKKKKKAAAKSDLRTCPCCKKHCPLTAPKCSKGRKIAKKLGIA